MGKPKFARLAEVIEMLDAAADRLSRAAMMYHTGTRKAEADVVWNRGLETLRDAVAKAEEKNAS